ncbi:hypothetical protein E2562_024707 [Oryza meyeriana var. granulata]|uniref:F-box domain-containing protein n=1 Tax=Oryza meyeriana var. granulata TaxID=110450 RepID=A0A6G1D951_9ORYZ|nr:hypothetical protein E2562_024707 [Oryza meyeriana var. granulata]
MAPLELMDDVVAEILLRLPPGDPSCAIRASAVSKPWHRLLADPIFLRRYRAFHRTPPLLGFIHHVSDYAGLLPSFARAVGLTVWDLMTGDVRRLREPHIPCSYSAAVLILAGDVVHFLTYFGKSILRYDLSKLELSVILPPAVYGDGDALLMRAEDGELGMALFDGEGSLHLWAWVAGADGDPEWSRRSVIDLYTVLPFLDPVCPPSLVGFAEGTDIIFLHTTHGDLG